jgi:glycosyltransferase involved in cell wall biosynthesis
MLRSKKFVLKFVGDESWERAKHYRKTEKRLEEFLANPDGGWKIRAMMRIQRFVLRRAAFVTTPSAYLRNELVHHYGLNPSRVIVNYNAAEAPSFSPFPAQPKLHQIVATARLTSWKGIDGIIRATAILAKKIPDVHLIIAGDGPEEANLRTLTRELNLEKHVTFLGNISRAETWQLRKNSAVYVLNSTYEGLPHTALTTFAARIPIVATNIPGTNEAVIDGETGLLVEPGDDTGLAAAIERLFSDSRLRTQLVDNASKYLDEKFSWDAHLAGLEGLFQSVLPEPRDEA